jgi:hypothetical protein
MSESELEALRATMERRPVVQLEAELGAKVLAAINALKVKFEDLVQHVDQQTLERTIVNELIESAAVK